MVTVHAACILYLLSDIKLFYADVACMPPSVSPGVRITTIREGQVIAYQCEEGFVPEGRVESQCDINKKWSPDPTLHACREVTNTGKSQSSMRPNIMYTLYIMTL